jgi:hypothetical protein
MGAMKFGNVRGAVASLARLLVIFVVIRVLEAAWILLTFGLASAIAGQNTTTPVNTWTVGEALAGGITLVRYYYFALGYMVTSAVVFLVSWAAGRMKSARNIAITNLCTYLGHSMLVIIVAFDGVLPPVIWAVWILAALYNALISVRIVRFLTMNATP